MKSAISRGKMLSLEKVIKKDEGVVECILTAVIASLLFLKKNTHMLH